jgi:hypothetical protein
MGMFRPEGEEETGDWTGSRERSFIIYILYEIL